VKRLFPISFAILLFLGSLFPFSDMEEVFKLPALLKHYQEHKQRAPKEDFNFFDFLALHYLDANHSNAEEHDLPLYQHECSASVFIMPSFADFTIRVSDFTDIKYSNLFHFNYFYQYTGFLLQPPRSV